jgi:hypothetical protein
MGMQVVVLYSDPVLTWETSKLRLGSASKFRLARQPGLGLPSLVPWSRLGSFLWVSVPRYQEGTLVWYVWANKYCFVSHMWRFVWRVILCKMYLS